MIPPIQRDVDLGPLNTFGIEAHAARFARLESKADLVALHASSEWHAGPRLILGGGSNLVLAGDFAGLVVQVSLRGRSLLAEEEDAWLVRVAAGENWHELVQWTLASGWPGLENLALIPGTVGAAPVQNIGAYGVELAERFLELEAFDTRTGTFVTLDRAACTFAYRDSIFKGVQHERYLITAVTLRLPRPWQAVLEYGDLKALVAPSPQQVANAVIAIRRSRLPDPAELGNAGSFFKNPVIDAITHAALKAREPDLVSYPQPDGRHKLAAGWLIERCGWRGRAWPPHMRAAVHARQSLVLVNHGGASGAEILALADAIQRDVASRFGVALEIEPNVIGLGQAPAGTM